MQEAEQGAERGGAERGEAEESMERERSRGDDLLLSVLFGKLCSRILQISPSSLSSTSLRHPALAEGKNDPLTAAMAVSIPRLHCENRSRTSVDQPAVSSRVGGQRLILEMM